MVNIIVKSKTPLKSGFSVATLVNIQCDQEVKMSSRHVSDYLNWIKGTSCGQHENLCQIYFIVLMGDKEVF